MARRKLVWARLPAGITSLSAATAGGVQSEAQDLLTDYRTAAGITAGPVGLTIMRIRIHISGLAAPTASGVAQQYILGVRVADFPEMVAAEVDATTFIPSANPHQDWMVFEPFTAHTNSGTTANSLWYNHYVDARAMRKMDELGQTLMMVVGSVPPGATPGASALMTVTASTLLALP